MFRGNRITTKYGEELYIVDYPSMLIPKYDEETAKKITEQGRELLKIHELFEKNGITLNKL